MNSYYLFLTIHNSYDVDMVEIRKVVKKLYPDAMVIVSDEEFEGVR